MTPKFVKNLNIGVTWYQCLTDKKEKKNKHIFCLFLKVFREVTPRLLDKI